MVVAAILPWNGVRRRHGRPFWAMATSRHGRTVSAAGIAMINSMANFGGYFGPDIIGFFRTMEGFGEACWPSAPR